MEKKNMREAEDEMREWTNDRGNGKIIDNFVVVVDVAGGGGEPLKCDACLLDTFPFVFAYKETKFYILYRHQSTHLPTTDMKKDEMEESTLKTKIE